MNGNSKNKTFTVCDGGQIPKRVQHDKRKVAFTLAETLIAIAIIGIVAALTIPNLVSNYQKKVTAERLKTVYSLLSQAIQRSEVDNGEISGWNFEQASDIVFDKYLLNYIKISKKTTISTSLVRSNIFYKQISGDNVPSTNSLWVVRSPVEIYTLNNGTDIIIAKTTPNYSSFIRWKVFDSHVDINGVKKGPNQYGKDMFVLSIDSRQGYQHLYFWGTYGTGEYTFESEPNTDRDVLLGKKNPKTAKYGNKYPCSKNGKIGGCCGRLIQVDGWKIADDYPW